MPGLGYGEGTVAAPSRSLMQSVLAVLLTFGATLAVAGCVTEASSRELARGQTGQPHALAREVRLVGIACIERGPGEVATLVGEEPAETENALQDLRAVADGRQEAASQLTLAEAELRGESLNPLSRVEQTDDGRLNRGVRRTGGHEPRRHCFKQAENGARIGITAQLLAWIEAQLGDGDPAVPQLGQRHPERRSARAWQEPRAADEPPRLCVRVPRPRVRSGDDGALPLAPDDVCARVRNDPNLA